MNIDAMADEIIEGNKLIAEFMGLIECNKPYKGAFTTNNGVNINSKFFVNFNILCFLASQTYMSPFIGSIAAASGESISEGVALGIVEIV